MKIALRLLLPLLWISMSFGFKIINKWKHIDYEWESKEQKAEYIKSGQYLENASIPIDVLIIDTRAWITIPRTTGVPASLGTIDIWRKWEKVGVSPAIKPYPDWSWADISSCDNIISVYRIEVDDCMNLWVLDNGKVDDKKVCPPKLLRFDARTSRLIDFIEIPDEYAFNSKGDGLLVNLAIKTYDENCDFVSVYMADVEGYGLVVMRENGDFKRYDSESFEPTKGLDNFTINGDSFHLADGVLGLALHKDKWGRSTLFGNPLASYEKFKIRTDDLDNFERSFYRIHPLYSSDIKFRNAPLAIQGDNCVFSLLEKNNIVLWNVKEPYEAENLKEIAKSDEELQFTSGLKFRKDIQFERPVVYGLSNKYQKLMAGKWDINEYNFHIFMQELP